MKRRWLEIMAVLIAAAWLALFTMGCPPPQTTPAVESGSSADKKSSDSGPPLDQPDAAMEEQAGQPELAPVPQDVQPIPGGGHQGHN